MSGDVNVDYKACVNILGAGDWFAGAFIVSQLRGDTVFDSVIFAHEETEKMIDGKYSDSYRW
jgi:sugar/nucleoside kinase (ribokinase family)